MNKARFAQPVSMVCTKEQFEQYLKKPLENLGYDVSECEFYEGDAIIATSYLESGNAIAVSLKVDPIYSYYTYFINHFNPELFLAIAGMREGDDIHEGEYVKITGKQSVESKSLDGQIKRAKSVSKHGLSEFGNGTLDVYDGIGGGIHLNEVRKATLQDLIKKFGRREDKKETDSDYQMDALRYAAKIMKKDFNPGGVVSKAANEIQLPIVGKINVGEDDLPKDELARHLSLTNLIMGYCYNDFTEAHELYLKIGQELESRLKAERKHLTAKQKEIKQISFIK